MHESLLGNSTPKSPKSSGSGSNNNKTKQLKWSKDLNTVHLYENADEKLTDVQLKVRNAQRDALIGKSKTHLGENLNLLDEVK